MENNRIYEILEPHTQTVDKFELDIFQHKDIFAYKIAQTSYDN